MIEVNNFLLDDVFVNIRPMTADKSEGIDKDVIEAVDNFLSDDEVFNKISKEDL